MKTDTHTLITTSKEVHPKQVSVNNALVHFVADDLIPLSVVDSTRFKTLLGTLVSQYQLPSRKHLSSIY